MRLSKYFNINGYKYSYVFSKTSSSPNTITFGFRMQGAFGLCSSSLWILSVHSLGFGNHHSSFMRHFLWNKIIPSLETCNLILHLLQCVINLHIFFHIIAFLTLRIQHFLCLEVFLKKTILSNSLVFKNTSHNSLIL